MNQQDTNQFDEESYQRSLAAYQNFYHPEDTPLQKAQRAFQARAEAYHEEMMRLHNGGKDIKGNAGWKRLRRQ